MLNVLRPALARLLDAGRPGARAHPGHPQRDHHHRHRAGRRPARSWLFPTGHLFAGTLVCTVFRLGRHARRGPGPGQGHHRRLGRVPGLHPGPGSRRGGVRRAGRLVRPGGHSRLLAVVALFCLVAGALVSYAKARAEGLGLRCDVGIAERTERLVIGLVSAGLSGLGRAVRPCRGLWVLAVRARSRSASGCSPCTPPPAGASCRHRAGHGGAGYGRADAGDADHRLEERDEGHAGHGQGLVYGSRLRPGLALSAACPSPGPGRRSARRRHRLAPAGPAGPAAGGATCAGCSARGDRQGTAGAVPGRDALLRPLLDGGLPAAGDQPGADPGRHRLQRRANRPPSPSSRPAAAWSSRCRTWATGTWPAPGSSPAGRARSPPWRSGSSPSRCSTGSSPSAEASAWRCCPPPAATAGSGCWRSGCARAGWSACPPTGTSPAAGSRWSSSARRRG